MSVINQMLNDLDARKPPQSAPQPGINHSQQTLPRNRLVPLLLLALSVCLAGLLYLWFHPQRPVVAIEAQAQPSVPVAPVAPVAPVVPQAAQQEQVVTPPAAVVGAKPVIPTDQPVHNIVAPDIVAAPPVAAVEPVAQAEVAVAHPVKQAALAAKPQQAPEPKLLAEIKAPAKAEPVPSAGQATVASAPASAPKPDKGRVTFAKQTQSRSQQLGLLLNQARTAWHQQQPKKALASYRQLLQLEPKHISGRNEYAQILSALSRRQEAEALLLEGIKQHNAPQPWVIRLASMRAEQGDYSGGLQALALLTEPPKQLDYFSLQAALATKLGRFELASEAYLWLTQQQPENGRWWLGLAVSYEQLQRHQQALSAYITAAKAQHLSRKSQTYIQAKIAQLRSQHGG